MEHPNLSTNKDIRTEDVFVCLVCGFESKQPLYSNLRDPLYNVSGEWNYVRCSRCKLIFLSPRPTFEDIGKAYTIYPTHHSEVLPRTLLRRWRSYAKGGYLANRFGYTKNVGVVQRLSGWFIHLHPGWSEYINGNVMYLSKSRKGRVLDVGCGAGETLTELRQLGWKAEGVEPDTKAATVARGKGLKVWTGELADQRFPQDRFDAVIISHVIEHVHNPVGLLAECARVLKPGGQLVVATPNAESLGARYFGRHWRVLEPPRHLTVFSQRTLELAAQQANLSVLESKTTVRGADGIFAESRQIRSGNQGQARSGIVREKLLASAYLYGLSVLLKFCPLVGEELLMVSEKAKSSLDLSEHGSGDRREHRHD